MTKEKSEDLSPIISEPDSELKSFLGKSNDFLQELKKNKQDEDLNKMKDSAIESSIVPFLFLNMEGAISFTNKAFLQLFSYQDHAELDNCHFPKLLLNQEESEKMMEVIFKDGHWSGEELGVSKHGKIVDIYITAGLVYDSLGKSIGVMVTMLDIRTRKEAERAKEQLQAQLIQSAKMASLGVFSTSIAHELNNPLTGVLGLSTLIKKDNTVSEEIRNYGNEIYIAAQRMKDKLSHMVSFARQSKKEDEKLLSINDPIRNSLLLLQQQCKKQNVTVNLNLAQDLSLMFGDQVKLESIFQNLLVNSLHAYNDIDDDRIKEINISTSMSSDQTIQITYRDNACGMGEEVKDRIFDPFFTTKPAGEGTGLGMSITHQIVESHQGTILAESLLEKGTTFIISFPSSN